MKRSLIAAGAAAAALALGLAGCAGTGSSSSGSGTAGSTTLRVAVWNLQQTPEFGALFSAFEKANPSITIQPVDILAANYEDKITTMLAGGDTTDIITVKNLTDYAGYAQKKQLVDVADVVKGLPTADIPATESYKTGSAYYAVPYRQDFSVLYYNKKMFADAGVADPENLTWDEFAADAAKLTTGDGADKVYGAYIHTWNSMVQGYAAAQQDESYDKPDYSWMADQYKLTLGMQKAGTIMDWATANSQQVQYKDMFEKGKAAMVPMGTWLIAPLLADTKAGTTDVDWGIAPIPQLKSGTKITTMGGPTGFGINKNSKNTAAAEKFLAFAAGPEGAKAVAAVGIVPAYHSDEITKQYFGLDGMPSDALSKTAFDPDVIRPDGPTGTNAAAIGTILNQEHQLIMTGSSSVADATAEMASRVKSDVLHQ
ncbi:ABC transporter substrate-binding protein [Leifsonia aquatica]|uniref:Multiple sugar transport system substrate-binding protein n=2 Tax=Leifsonia aquatica TaxID=144185 RepID=A0A7W4UYD0_LEIAQ|nr:sugar ABC transporter substrate-binding protein [Leifsonia aquatica]MBB2968533.1 multiple sugar transport system substrate-binding protein [Leifsonia aquatica]